MEKELNKDIERVLKGGYMRKIICNVLIGCLALLQVAAMPVEAKGKMQLNQSKITVLKGAKFRLKVLNKKNKEVKWKSTNKKIVTVTKKGLVFAKGKGTAKVVATNGNKNMSCKVTVKTKISCKWGKKNKLFTYDKLKKTYMIRQCQGEMEKKVVSKKGIEKICAYLSNITISEDTTNEKFVGGLMLQLINKDTTISFSLGKKLMYDGKTYIVPDGTVDQVAKYVTKYCL